MKIVTNGKQQITNAFLTNAVLTNQFLTNGKTPQKYSYYLRFFVWIIYKETIKSHSILQFHYL
jgi:hypothetical protein